MMHMNKTHKRMMRRHRYERGFTLLLAALISSIVLALGTAIFELAQKQVALSSIGRDSQFAFYAADTIAECALYWDFRYTYFASSTPASVSPVCDGQSLLPFDTGVSVSQPYAYPYTMTSPKVTLFQNVAVGGNTCAQVIITKTLDSQTNAVRTTVHADGYSTDCATISTSPRALQRSVELQY
jgi:hypothetical protein